MQQNDELLSFVDKKLYYGLFLKRISEELVDKESKVVRDREDDNVLRDLLHRLHGYLTFCGQVYSFNSLLYPEMPSKSKKESFSAVILVKANHKLKTVMLDSLNIHEFLSSRLLYILLASLILEAR